MELIRKIASTILLALFYVKFVITIIHRHEGPEVLFVDILLYSMCLFSINYRKVNYSIFIVVWFLLVAIITSSARTFALLIMTLYVLKDFNIRSIAKLNILFSLIVFAYVAFEIQIGAIEDKIMWVQETSLKRRDFGFGNPNTLAIFTLGTLANVYILIAKNHKWLTITILGVVSWIVTMHTGSRTFGAVMITMIIYYLFQNRHSTKQSNNRIIKLLPLIITGATLCCAFAVHILPALDILFSFRLSLYSQLLFQTSPMGYIIGNSMIDKITIDSSYMHLLFRAGIGGFILFYYMYRNTISNISEQNRYMLPLIFGMMLYATTESYLLFTLTYNNMIIWLFLFQNGLRKHKNSII